MAAMAAAKEQQLFMQRQLMAQKLMQQQMYQQQMMLYMQQMHLRQQIPPEMVNMTPPQKPQNPENVEAETDNRPELYENTNNQQTKSKSGLENEYLRYFIV